MVDFSDYMIKLKRRVENYFTSKKIDLTPFDFLFSDKKTVYEKPVIIDEIESSKYFNKERSSTDYVKWALQEKWGTNKKESKYKNSLN